MILAGFGIACLDMIAETGPEDNNRTSAITRYTERAGGLVANALIAGRRLGAEARILTALGGDNAGSRILSLLDEEKIDTGYVRRYPGEESYFSFIRIDPRDGERYIYCKRDTIAPSAILTDLAPLEEADVFLTDSHFREASLRYAKAACEMGVPVVGDYKISPEKTDILRYTDYPIISRDYALSLAEDGRIPTALEVMAAFKPDSVPVITCGAEGCYYLYRGRCLHVPAFEITAVDTCAAGDVFHGGFAWAIGSGYSVRAALVFASAVSALKCSRFGGSAGAPELWEVKDFLRKHNL